MKKTITIALAAMFVLGASAYATTVTVALKQGANMIAAPVAPYDSNPDVVFADTAGNALPVAFNLTRFDAVQKGYIPYSPYSSDYGGVLLGDGAWLAMDNDVVWQYDGAPNGLPDGSGVKTDMWISLPAAGAALFGNPFNDQITFANCLMTDGTQTVSLDQARNLGWFDGTCTGFDAVGQGYVPVGIDPWYAQTLDPGQAYWITTNQDNLALIIPAVN